MGAKLWHVLMGVCAFIAAISFFQINSWWADQHHFNGVKGWLGIGIVFSLLAIGCLYKVVTNSDGGGGSSVK
mgnify:CR=1 FL=1